MSDIREECGVFGVFSPEPSPIALTCFYGLFALQHRGQESCGIVVNDDGVFRAHKDLGMVADAFKPETLDYLGKGEIAVGHVRYATTGCADRHNTQPMVVNHHKGHLAIAHNGNLVNSDELRTAQEKNGCIFHSTSDTEVISYVIIKHRLKTDTIERAVSDAMYELKGAYSLVISSPRKLIAARDPHGFRPLCYGKTQDGRYVVASESCALDAVGARFIRDIRPGEVLVFDKSAGGVYSLTEHCDKEKQSLCVFEYIYFARPDSVIDGCPIQKARLTAGRLLAESHPIDADVVIGVPDSGLDAAMGYSARSGIPLATGFIKNKYIGRTFISPGQKAREDLVKIKLNTVNHVIEGKRVIMIDDSIVRGTTSKKLVSLLRGAGAKEIHVLVSAPPFVNSCYYGVDIDSNDFLIAKHHTVEETAKLIGADSLGYLDAKDLYKLGESGACKGYCTACFTGDYPTEVPKFINKNRFERKLSEKERWSV